jgi:hypothetical protein
MKDEHFPFSFDKKELKYGLLHFEGEKAEVATDAKINQKCLCLT